MCDLATRELLERILEEKCWRGEMFTAFDVTREARRRGCRERHRHLKHIIHEAFDNGMMGAEYTRILIEIPGADQPAWLYFHEADDPAEYMPVDRRLFGPPQPQGLHSVPAVQTQHRRRTGRSKRRTVFSLLSFFSGCPHCSSE